MRRQAILALVALALLGGCRSTQGIGADSSRELSNVSMMGVDQLHAPTHRESFSVLQYTPDPIEGFNRGSLGFTKGAIDWVVKPLAKGWRFLIPEPARRSVDNFAYNLSWPVRFISLLLQGRPIDSAKETGHFLMNTTVGVAGLFDPASRWGIPTYREDVGQAFARWGSGPGFYFVIPFLGPSSGRDALGRLFDTALNPATYVGGAGLLFNMNAFTFKIDGYEALTANESELYLPVRALWSIQRRVEVENYTIPPEAYASSDPEPSLGNLLVKVKDPSFPRKAREHRVEVPSTGRALPYSLWLQEEPAPLVYLIPGIGAHRGSTNAVALAEMAFQRGHSVAAVSSPFHREFLLNGLSQPYPGYTPSDAEDLYQALSLIRADLDSRHPGQVSSARLLGYSMGAIESLHIASAQERRPPGALRFERVVAINPPVDLMYAARHFDGYFDAPLRWPASRRDQRVLDVGLKAFLVAQKGLGGKPLPFDRTESEFLIGLAGRNTIINTVAAIEERTGKGLTITPQRDPVRGPLLAVVNESSLESYGNQLIVPHYTGLKGTTREQLVHEAGLRGLGDSLGSDERVRIVTNANDFLLGAKGLAWLEGTLGDRLTVFPDGGHLGNLHIPAVQEAVFRALGSPRGESLARSAAAGR